MATGRERADWSRASLIAAVVWNTAPTFGKRRRPSKSPDDFDPYSEKRRRERRLSFKEMLGRMFERGGKWKDVGHGGRP